MKHIFQLPDVDLKAILIGDDDYTAYDYWVAPSGEGPLAAIWADKPHRLVYDLLQAIPEATKAEVTQPYILIQVNEDRDWTTQVHEYATLLEVAEAYDREVATGCGDGFIVQGNTFGIDNVECDSMIRVAVAAARTGREARQRREKQEREAKEAASRERQQRQWDEAEARKWARLTPEETVTYKALDRKLKGT